MLLALVGGAGVIAGIASFSGAPVQPAPAPVVVPPPGGWPAMAAHADGVVKYVLEAKLDPGAHTIDGKGTVTLRNVAQVPLRDLRLHLYLNAFANDRTVFRRARVGGFRGDHEGANGYVDVKRLVVQGEDLWPKRTFVSHQGESPQDPLAKGAPPPVAGAPDDETDVRVPLSKELPPGESLTFDLEFHDQLPEVSERTGYHDSFHFAGQWFPKLAKLETDGTWAAFPFHHVAEFYADYGSFDVTVDVPSSFTIGACGPLVSSKVENGRRIERHVVDDVHDFAFTAWDRFVSKQRTIEGVAVTVLGPPGYDDALERELLSVEHGLRDKNARFGAYPYPVLTVVHPPSGADEAGGMEYPTLITTGGSWFPKNPEHEIEAVTIHELGHQWFYGLLGSNEVEWPSGDEGFNTYADELALTTLFGPGGAATFGPLTLSSDSISRRGIPGPFDEPIFEPAYDFANGRSYGSRVYGATAMSLVTLRNVFGPQRFDTAMGVYARAQRFHHPRPEDFFRTLAQFCSAECADAARIMLTTATSYDVYVDSVASEKAKTPAGYFDTGKGYEKRTADTTSNWSNAVWIGRRGELDLPVDVELRFADGSRVRREVRFGPPPVVGVGPKPFDVAAVATGIPSETVGPRKGSTWVRIDADGPQQLVGAIVDPDKKILVDRDRLNNFGTIAGRRGSAPITRERALAWLEILLREVGP